MQAIFSLLTSGNGIGTLLFLLVIPAVLGLLCLLCPKKQFAACSAIMFLGVAINFVLALVLFRGEDVSMLIPWAGFGINLSLRLYSFSRLMLLVSASALLLVGLYSISFLKKKSYANTFMFYFMLIVAFGNGVFLANNFAVLLFFWEGMMIVVFAMQLLVKQPNVKTASKALLLNAVADFLLMLGIAFTFHQSNSLMMDVVSGLPIEGIGVWGYTCMMLGAIGKAGGFPFHSWIPDAAENAPLPFMAILPAAMEKFLGVYLMIRISTDFYQLTAGSAISQVIMWIGAATIIFAALMALIQKDIKRMLAFHAVSQVGYMIIGVGSALPVGLVGALFHMLNHAIYKCGLFLATGSIERATGSTHLHKIGGLFRKLPVTAIFFIITALSISGIPPFNGFFSKELIFDAALESGTIFYIIALVGAFFTAASFLKVSHAAFFGPFKLPEDINSEDVREAPGAMLLPNFILALLCLGLGIFNKIPITAIQNILGEGIVAGANFAGWPGSAKLVLLSLGVVLLAIINHIIGFSMSGRAEESLDHLRKAPLARQLYDAAEEHLFDPYEIFKLLGNAFSNICYCVDYAVNWIYDVLFVKLVTFVTESLHSSNTGSTSRYLVAAFSGVAFLALLFMLLM